MKLTDTQRAIFRREPEYKCSKTCYPIYGSGEHRSINTLVKRHMAEITSIQPYHHSFVYLTDYGQDYLKDALENLNTRYATYF